MAEAVCKGKRGSWYSHRFEKNPDFSPRPWRWTFRANFIIRMAGEGGYSSRIALTSVIWQRHPWIQASERPSNHPSVLFIDGDRTPFTDQLARPAAPLDRASLRAFQLNYWQSASPFFPAAFQIGRLSSTGECSDEAPKTAPIPISYASLRYGSHYGWLPGLPLMVRCCSVFGTRNPRGDSIRGWDRDMRLRIGQMRLAVLILQEVVPENHSATINWRKNEWKFVALSLRNSLSCRSRQSTEEHKTLGGGTMRKQMVCELLLILAFSGCTTTDINYADRNNVDTARARCVQLARTSGYEDIKTEAINRDGQAEWKVELQVRKDGKDGKERCEYNARTDRVHMG